MHYEIIFSFFIKFTLPNSINFQSHIFIIFNFFKCFFIDLIWSLIILQYFISIIWKFAIAAMIITAKKFVNTLIFFIKSISKTYSNAIFSSNFYIILQLFPVQPSIGCN